MLLWVAIKSRGTLPWGGFYLVALPWALFFTYAWGTIELTWWLYFVVRWLLPEALPWRHIHVPTACYSLALELCPSYSHDSPLSLGHMGPSPLWALIYPTKRKSCWWTSSFYSTPYKISQRKELPDSRLFFEMEIIDKTNHILEKRNDSASSKRTWQ